MPTHSHSAATRLSNINRSTITSDVFCTVINNFGDIGVCWRLARQLVSEHGWQVRIFVDNLRAFQKLHPTLHIDKPWQIVDGVIIEHWHKPSYGGTNLQPADVVIETFACKLPSVYIAAMAKRERKPIWLNLEYLSGEDWVPNFHLRPSPHPHYPLVKTFFFPGLGPGTGGVLKECNLDRRRVAFETSPAKQADWWQHTIGQALPTGNYTIISLFAYKNSVVDALFEQWCDSAIPIILLVPENHISNAVARFFGLPSFSAFTHAQRGSVTAYSVAFTDQHNYDILLWASDFNFVRGEDSFVRAQWATRPFVWHIYPQTNNAHLSKLDAALVRYTRTLPTNARNSLIRFWHAWNGDGVLDWADFAQHQTLFSMRGIEWAKELTQIGDLASNLVKFVKIQLKCSFVY